MRCMKCQQDKDQQFLGQRVCKECARENDKQRTPKMLRAGTNKKAKHKKEGYQ